MFDGNMPVEPAFFEFCSPVYFDGIGYVEKVAISPEFADSQCPTITEYVAAADGYLFRVHNGACTCVSSANVKFLAGKLAVVGGPGDGDKDRVGSKSVPSGGSEGQQQKVVHGSQQGTGTQPPKPRGPGRPPLRRGGAW